MILGSMAQMAAHSLRAQRPEFNSQRFLDFSKLDVAWIYLMVLLSTEDRGLKTSTDPSRTRMGNIVRQKTPN